ncbi:competence protein CoiA family protein [Nocardia transvalensis]|uniref:competence protein CoiA family protein n=1 Tax=Nocardia transvalensis TaxID=37333 RepID=UPI0018944902|nr:competence protein CoiA family protein [Nocardia transvalensis]MBF6332415.1 hypothetical protein [Nocardia transvalensis]
MGTSNNLTVALDVVHHQYVCAPADPAHPLMDELRAKSCSGDQTLVCALCYAGVGAPPGTWVPVVVRGRIGGEKRPHFAHPAGQGPAGGTHEPESMWHLASKMALEAWARAQPSVVDVHSEVWLPNRERRCDVRVTFADGSQIALEAQGYRMTDAEWTNRHRDYQQNGVTDVWLWHPNSPIPWIVLSDTEHPQQLWTFDPWERAATLMVGAPHQRQGISTECNIFHRVEHLPPCIGDELHPYRFSLPDLTLTPTGIEIPTGLQTRLEVALEQEQRCAKAIENERNRALLLPSPPPGLSIVSTPSRPTPRADEKPVPGPKPLDPAARAQLDWLTLQNAVMAAGHVIDCHDAPSLPLPPARPRAVRCTLCSVVFTPNLSPGSVARCGHHEADRDLRAVEPAVRVGRAGYLGISAGPTDLSKGGAIRRGA